MSAPTTETIARTGRGTAAPADRSANGGAMPWPEVEALLRKGGRTSWLSVRGSHGGVHTRPVFAAWAGDRFFFASKSTAAKTGHLRADGHVSLAIDLVSVHLVVEGVAARVTDRAGLGRASTAMDEVYGWPTEVVGDELDTPYAAPTSGGPPLQAWALTPARAFVFPTEDQVEPTRFLF